VASVKLFKVVLLPEDGLPTRPIKGSRGIVSELMMLCNIKTLESLEASAGKSSAFTPIGRQARLSMSMATLLDFVLSSLL